MKKADVVVVGGSAAGVTAAITSRRHYPDKSVLLVRKENQVLIPCGIPYIFGTVGKPDKNLIPDAVLEKNNIEFMVMRVSGLEPEKHLLATDKGEEIAYDKLVLATGSLPIKPPIPGIDKKNIFAVEKDVDYLQQVLDALESARDLLIVGCGFIGVELAEECKKNRNINITIVEMMRHCLMLTYDREFAINAENALREKGINILGEEKVVEFLGNGKVEKVRLSSGKEIKVDLVLMGIGASTNTEPARSAGLEIGPTKGILVNRYMQSSDPNIFACGDCAEKVSFFDGKPSPLKLASIATMEARLAGANLFETRRVNMGVIGIFSTLIGDSVFAAAGLTETSAKQMGYNTVVGEAEAPNRHPAGMPGMENMKVKLVFEKGSGGILGGQISGARSGGELINALSACIHHRMTADEMATFQLGTHPALTASPISYQLTNAAEMAIMKMR